MAKCKKTKVVAGYIDWSKVNDPKYHKNTPFLLVGTWPNLDQIPNPNYKKPTRKA